MKEEPIEDPILAAVTRACLALPEATRELMGQHARFSVRKRTFAYFLDNHHGDGVIGIVCKTALGENEEMVRRDPERFYRPAYLGAQGWIGLCLDRGEVDWNEVAELAAASYCLIAPKSLAAVVAARS